MDRFGLFSGHHNAFYYSSRVFPAQGNQSPYHYPFFTGSIFIFLTNGFAWKHLFFSLTKNMSIIALVISVPFLSLPVAKGGFGDSLKGFYQRYVRTSRSYLAYTTIVTYLLIFFVNVAAVPLVFELVDTQWRQYPKRLTAAAVTRGFSAATIWAPNVISIAIVLQYLPVTWHQLAPGAALISVLVLLAGLLIEWFRKAENQVMVPECSNQVDWKKIFELLLTGLILIFLILALNPIFGLSVVQAVPVVALVFPCLWVLLKEKRAILVPEFKRYFVSLPKYSREVVIFTAAGSFAEAVQYSAFSDVLAGYIQSMHFVSPVVFCLLLLWFIIAASIIGIHPIITVTVFISSLDPANIGISIMQFAFLLLVGWSLGICVSPVGTSSVLTASHLDEEPSKVGTVWNLKYAIIISCFVSVLLNL